MVVNAKTICVLFILDTWLKCVLDLRSDDIVWIWGEQHFGTILVFLLSLNPVIFHRLKWLFVRADCSLLRASWTGPLCHDSSSMYSHWIYMAVLYILNLNKNIQCITSLQHQTFLQVHCHYPLSKKAMHTITNMELR